MSGGGLVDKALGNTAASSYSSMPGQQAPMQQDALAPLGMLQAYRSGVPFQSLESLFAPARPQAPSAPAYMSVPQLPQFDYSAYAAQQAAQRAAQLDQQRSLEQEAFLTAYRGD